MDFLILVLIVMNIFLSILYFVLFMENLDRRHVARRAAEAEEMRRRKEGRSRFDN
ncbi:MAG: hypothetical protein AAF618_02625 [Pseudomonadota bacterium]